MSAGYQNQQNLFQQPEVYEEEDIEFINDEGDDMQLEDMIDRRFNSLEDNRFVSRLQFHVHELGITKQFNGEIPIYVPGDNCFEAMKDIVQLVKADDEETRACRVLLGKWGSVKTDFLPLFLKNTKDKKLSLHLLTVFVYMTNPIEEDCANWQVIKDDMRSLKELLTEEIFWDVLVIHMIDCVKIEAANRTTKHDMMLELCIVLIRNILAIECSDLSERIKGAYKTTIQAKLYLIFSSSGGVFSALVYLSQNFESPLMAKLIFTILEIFHLIFSSFPAFFLFGRENNKKYLDSLKEKKKALRMKRLSNMSSRHSRFGAMVAVKTEGENRCSVVSKPNYNAKDIFSNQGQRLKPKPAARFNTTNDNIITHNLIISNNYGELTQEEHFLKLKLRSFSLDFLQHSYSTLVEACYSEIYKNPSDLNDSDLIAFFSVVSFGIECYTLGLEKLIDKTAHSGVDGGLDTRGENSKSNGLCQLKDIAAGLETSVLDILYRLAVKEATKKKAEVNAKLFHSCINLFYQVLRITYMMSKSSNHIDVKNSSILTQNVFSKEFSKVLKVGIEYYEPRMHGGPYVEKLVLCMDMFFTLLSGYGAHKVLTLKTDKRIKNKFLNKSKQDKQDDEEDEEALEYGEDDEDDDYLFKERRFNYQSELSIFASYDTISKMLNFVKGESLIENSEEINTAVSNYIRRILRDLDASWLFFQADFLAIMEEVTSNEMLKRRKDLKPFMEAFLCIYTDFFKAFAKNELISVESLFRFPDLAVKDQILNNYEEQAEFAADDDYDPYAADDDDGFGENKDWTPEEYVILKQAFPNVMGRDDTIDQLCQILKMAGFDRSKKDVKNRMKSLNVESSDPHSYKINLVEKISIEEGVVQLLLYGISTSREVEALFIDLLREITEDYEQYRSIYEFTKTDFAIVPTTPRKHKLLSMPFIIATFVSFEFVRPRQGVVYWRIPSYLLSTDIQSRLSTFLSIYNNLKDEPENVLLDKGDAGIKRVRREPKSKLQHEAPKGKKLRKIERIRAEGEEREEQDRINQELALMGGSSDEEIELNFEDDPDKEIKERLEKLSSGLRELPVEDQAESSPKKKQLKRLSKLSNAQDN